MSSEKQTWTEMIAVLRVEPDGRERLQFLEDLPLIGPMESLEAAMVLARAGQRSRGNHIRVVRFTARETIQELGAAAPAGPPTQGQENFVGAIYDLAEAQGVTPELVFGAMGKDGDA